MMYSSALLRVVKVTKTLADKLIVPLSQNHFPRETIQPGFLAMTEIKIMQTASNYQRIKS